MNFQGFTTAPAQLTTGAVTYYTSSSVRSRIDKVTLTNPTGTDRNATIYKVQSGGSASDTTTVVYQKTVLAGQTVEVTELEGHWLENDGFIQALASAGSAISLMISGIKTPK